MGLSAILDVCPKAAYNNPLASKLVYACRQYLRYHLVMARATFRNNVALPNLKATLSKYLDPSTDTPTGISCNSKSIYQVESNQGFCNALLFLINDICDLADLQIAPDDDFTAETQEEVSKRVARIESDLQSLIQLPLDPSNQQESLEGGDDFQQRLQSIISTAEANRLTALLFLDEVCTMHFPQVVPKTRASRSTYIGNILSLVEEICEKDHVTAALPIWPVFIAGCSAGEEDRLRVLKIFNSFQCKRMFGVSNTTLFPTLRLHGFTKFYPCRVFRQLSPSWRMSGGKET